MNKHTFNKQHLIMVTTALVFATLGGLGATLLPDASGQWVQPALMLGIVGGLLGYIVHDLATRRPRTTLRALAVTTLALPLLIWLLSDSGLFAVLAAFVASLAVYIKGRMDDRWTQQVALGGSSQAMSGFDPWEETRRDNFMERWRRDSDEFYFFFDSRAGTSWDPRD
jgi:hypothetical protein